MAVVDSLYADFMDASKVLMSANEVSLQIMLESNLRKTLLLSSASYFEHTLSAAVGRFTEEVTFGNAMMLTLVHSKAISRQYHTWFDWDANNANKFFKLFGKVFYDHMTAIIGENDALVGNIRAFMEIGRQRNLLVHSDYASHFIDKTPDEIYALYLAANGFVGVVESELFSCSSKIKGEIAKA
jgi:hypothetical protein